MLKWLAAHLIGDMSTCIHGRRVSSQLATAGECKQLGCDPAQGLVVFGA
jgi:hypothetical protein